MASTLTRKRPVFASPYLIPEEQIQDNPMVYASGQPTMMAQPFPQMNQNMGPTLPENYGFNDLAAYEEARRNQFAKDIQSQLAERRKQLAEALNTQGQQLFQTANPGILEDLNSRGLFNSETARSQAQANALRDIGLSNQQYLNDFDTSATTAGLQSQQDALDAALDLRRGQLEGQLQDSQAAREEALARDLASQQRKQSLTESLIGLGGNLGSTYLTAKLFGGGGAAGGTGGVGGGTSGIGSKIGSLFGAGGGVSGTSLAGGAGAPSSSLFPNGLGAVGTPTSVGALGAGGAPSSTLFPGGLGPVASGGPSAFGAGGTIFNTAGTSSIGAGNIAPAVGGYYAGTRVFRPTQPGDQASMNVGGAIGGAVGSLYGPAGSAAGSFIGTGAGKASNRLQKGIEHSLGTSAGEVSKYYNPLTGIPAGWKKITHPKKALKSIGKSITSPVNKVADKVKDTFCFDGETKVSMEDGKTKRIREMNLGDKTKGGEVLSIRISKVGDGSIYEYKGMKVTGTHAVKEDGRWLRIKDSTYATPLNGPGIVFSLVTKYHRIFVNGIELADELESDDYESLTMDQSLTQLNFPELAEVR